MNVAGIVILIALSILVVWLGIDTAIYIVKKTKQKKLEKQQKQESEKTDN